MSIFTTKAQLAAAYINQIIIVGVFTFSEENISAVAPATLYKALVLDCDNLIPKVVDAVQSVDILEGTGGAGTIKKINFLEDGQAHYAKHKVEFADKDNFVDGKEDNFY